MQQVLMAKFTQVPECKEALLATGTKVVAEASPRDCKWGVGVGAKKALDPANWRGANLLGDTLVRVREEIRKVEPEADGAKRAKTE